MATARWRHDSHSAQTYHSGVCPRGRALVCAPAAAPWCVPPRPRPGVCPRGRALVCAPAAAPWCVPPRPRPGVSPRGRALVCPPAAAPWCVPRGRAPGGTSGDYRESRYRPSSRFMLSLVFLIQIASLMSLVLQSDSLSTHLAPSQSIT